MRKKANMGATARLKYAKSECRCGSPLKYAKSVSRTFKTFEKMQRPPKRHPKDHFNAYLHRDVGMRFFSLSAICKWRLSKSALYISRIEQKQNDKSQKHHKQKQYNIFIKIENAKIDKKKKKHNRRPADFKSRRRKKACTRAEMRINSLEKFVGKAFTKSWKHARLIKNRNSTSAQRILKFHDKISILII